MMTVTRTGRTAILPGALGTLRSHTQSIHRLARRGKGGGDGR